MSERAGETAIDRIREHVRAQVARTSLRKVAKRAGVKVGATKKFIDGSVPYERNLRLWKRYFARELREGMAGGPDDAVPVGDAAAVLDLLLWAFPEEERPDARREAVDLFRGLYVRRGRTPPAWIHDMPEYDDAASPRLGTDDEDDEDQDGDDD
ncbi:MAG: hypothetical protein KY467_11165 [Gemmatimonadetes bacterium]|nr:hypothetical protein [Gemmatimonadota bacterium]